MGSRTRALSLESPVVPVLLPHLLSVILPLADSGGPGTSEASPLGRVGSFSPFGPSTVWSPQGPQLQWLPPGSSPRPVAVLNLDVCSRSGRRTGWAQGFGMCLCHLSVSPGSHQYPECPLEPVVWLCPSQCEFWGKSLTPQMLSVGCLSCCCNS